MQLPRYLADAIEEITTYQRGSLAAASTQLTGRYKTGDFAAPALRNATDRTAYLVTRLPATFAAATHVFSELNRRAPQAEVSSLLDLGAGPGTALFAAAEIFPGLQRATLLEADRQWVEWGNQLAAQSPHDVVRRAEWLQRTLQSRDDLPQHDIVVFSYSFGELPPSIASSLLGSAWRSAARFLVVIEPGTVRGFGNINHAREALIAGGVEILAPCPHRNVCPMAQAGDWCHFAKRVERTSEHRKAKSGSLGYEDEKFSYLIASRQPFLPASARIVRHPRRHSGHVQLQLCTSAGLVNKTVTKSNKEAYKRARHAEWGGEWEE
jgi:ribosomal protein RSM22 (predicted rRNA methylase)